MKYSIMRRVFLLTLCAVMIFYPPVVLLAKPIGNVSAGIDLAVNEDIKSGKVEGYVSMEFLYTGLEAKIKAKEVLTLIATVNTTTLKVREEPSTESSINTLIPLGEELEVLEELEEWVKIAIDDEEGYIFKEYVDISEKLEKAVSLTELKFGEGISDIKVSLTEYAKQFIGNPYVWGGTSLTNGADCSGFVLSVFSKFGISLPHSSRAQVGYGRQVSISEAQPGDLFFYGKGNYINHVAIYIGNGQVVHASSEKTFRKLIGFCIYRIYFICYNIQVCKLLALRERTLRPLP